MFRSRKAQIVFSLGAIFVALAALYLFHNPRSARTKIETIDAMYRDYKKSFPNTPDISVDALLATQKTTRVVLVDVREPREREVSMIPGALSSQEFERNIDKYKDRTIVVYCTIGFRSGIYAEKLQNTDLTMLNLRGSILAWVHSGQQVVNTQGPTHRVHVYGPEWNLLPDDYQGVW